MEDSFAMKGGAGPTSYSQNSKFQGRQIALAKALLTDGIQQYLIVLPDPNDASRKVFRIADLGCSVGPNTFACVQTIIGAVELEYKSKGFDSNALEFQVFFNDRVGNDFNMLFLNLPLDRSYTAAGVPGSFHAKLFPRTSMDFFHSAYALHWLTKVPDDVLNPDTPMWNKGRITYAESAPEVAEAYKAQFIRDIKSFFSARSIEMADGGLLAILMPCRQEGTIASDSTLLKGFECMGHALVDMIEEGLVKEELVDSFNLPIFIPSASEVTEAASKVESLSIEMVKEIHSPSPLSTPEEIMVCCLHLQAVFGKILSQHFSSAITGMVFKMLPQKIEQFAATPSFISSQKVENLFVLIKKVAVSI